MKTTTCIQLGGACYKRFQANCFEEIAGMSKRHGMEMFHKGNENHIHAMNEMRELMKTPGAMNEWLEKKRMEFEAIPEDE